MVSIVSAALAGKYSSYRQLRALQRNGDPNEHELFHFCPDAIIPKIWQEVLPDAAAESASAAALACVIDSCAHRARGLTQGLQTGRKWAKARTSRST